MIRTFRNVFRPHTYQTPDQIREMTPDEILEIEPKNISSRILSDYPVEADKLTSEQRKAVEHMHTIKNMEGVAPVTQKMRELRLNARNKYKSRRLKQSPEEDSRILGAKSEVIDNLRKQINSQKKQIELEDRLSELNNRHPDKNSRSNQELEALKQHLAEVENFEIGGKRRSRKSKKSGKRRKRRTYKR